MGFFSWVFSFLFKNNDEVINEEDIQTSEEVFADDEVSISTSTTSDQQSTTIVLENYTMQTQNKYALLVGINKYMIPDSDLRGCVNDVENMRNLLINKFQFKPDNIRVLTDHRATFNGIQERLDWLIDVAKPGDQLVFHFSGHGSQVRDRDGDELNDYKDELICNSDLDWDNPFTDDILAEIFKQVPEGAFLSFICDSCHSGTMTKSICGNPHPVLNKFIEPPFDIRARSDGVELPVHRIGAKKDKEIVKDNVHYVSQNHMLISGCMDSQTSADAYIHGKYQGALTAHLIQAINENPDADWLAIHKRVLELLKGKYTQLPQLTGDEKYLKKKLFGRR